MGEYIDCVCVHRSSDRDSACIEKLDQGESCDCEAFTFSSTRRNGTKSNQIEVDAIILFKTILYYIQIIGLIYIYTDADVTDVMCSLNSTFSLDIDRYYISQR